MMQSGTVPMVSVIIPNYNHSAYLRERIASVLNQTFRDFELILLDDASADGSADLMRSLATDPRVTHIVINEVNSGGAFYQWKKGIELARGRYIWIAESDDHAQPEFLETLIGELNTTPGATLAFCKSVIVDEQGVPQKENSFEEPGFVSSGYDWKADGAEFCQRALCKYNLLLNASSVLFSSEAYMASGGIQTQYRICSDWILWWEIALRGKVVFSSRPLNAYRRHSSNASLTWEFELPVVYSFINTHWPGSLPKTLFTDHVMQITLPYHEHKLHKRGFRITSSISRLFALKVYLKYLFSPRKKA